MPSIRDHIGSSCPSCANDILQAQPSTNRMPGKELAWCGSCKSSFSLDQLANVKRGGGLLGRLFGRPHRG